MKDAIKMLQQMQVEFFSEGTESDDNNWDLKEKCFNDFFATVFCSENKNRVDQLNELVIAAENEGVLHRLIVEMFNPIRFEEELAEAWCNYRINQLSQTAGRLGQKAFKDWVAENGQWTGENCIHGLNDLFEYLEFESDYEVALFNIDEPDFIDTIRKYSLDLMQDIRKIQDNSKYYEVESDDYDEDPEYLIKTPEFMTENLTEIFKAEWMSFMRKINTNGNIHDYCWIGYHGNLFETDNLSDALLNLINLQQKRYQKTNYEFDIIYFWKWIFKAFNDKVWSEEETSCEDLKMLADCFGVYIKGYDKDDDDDDHQPRWR